MNSPKKIIATAALAALCLAAPPAAAKEEATAEAHQRSYELEAAGKHAEALAALGKIGAPHKGTYFFQLRLAWLSYLAGKHDASRAAYTAAARLAPAALEPLQGLMLPEIAQRRWADAARTARKLLHLSPGDFLGHSKLAWSLYNLGRFTEAEQAYRKVLALYPSDLTMRSGLGWSLLKQNKLAEARQVFAQVLAVSPRDKTAAAGMKSVGE